MSRNGLLKSIGAGRIRALRVGQKFFVPVTEIERLLLAARG